MESIHNTNRTFLEIQVSSANNPILMYPYLQTPEYIKKQRIYGFLSGCLVSAVAGVILLIYFFLFKEPLVTYVHLEDSFQNI